MPTSNLNTAIVAYQTALVTAGLTQLPQTFREDDLPAGLANRVFQLRHAAGPRLHAIYGGGTSVEMETDMFLEIRWDSQIGNNIVLTIADDTVTAMAVMLKQANKTTGIINVTVASPFATTSITSEYRTSLAVFTFRHREAIDVT